MFHFIGSAVVYGFAVVGLVTYLQRLKRLHSRGAAAERRAS